jgi:chorismate-pyruvate lyase
MVVSAGVVVPAESVVPPESIAEGNRDLPLRGK